MDEIDCIYLYKGLCIHEKVSSLKSKDYKVCLINTKVMKNCLHREKRIENFK